MATSTAAASRKVAMLRKQNSSSVGEDNSSNQNTSQNAGPQRRSRAGGAHASSKGNLGQSHNAAQENPLMSLVKNHQ